MRTEAEVLHLARTDPRLTDNAVALLDWILERLPASPCLSLARAASELGFSRRTASYSVSRLKSRGYLDSFFRGTNASAYSKGRIWDHPAEGAVATSSIESPSKALCEVYVGTQIVYCGNNPPPLSAYDDIAEEQRRVRALRTKHARKTA